MVAFDNGVFQVLPLPQRCLPLKAEKLEPGLHSLGAIFKHLGQKP
jgi:hypothetical protein